MVGLTAAAGTLLTESARATVARALTLAELLHESRYAVLATPVEMSSHWETIGRRRRIVTYSVVRLEGPLDDRSPPSGELVVRTLGGRVGKIGQIVHGEAALRPRERSALFLSEAGSNLFAITAMAQGHYPTRPDASGLVRLSKSPRLDALVETERSAIRLLDGLSLSEAQWLIVRELHPDAR